MESARYVLMNKNTELAVLDFSPHGYPSEIIVLKNAEALPVGVYADKKDVLLKNLGEWWRSRIIPASRDGLEHILRLYEIDSPSILSWRSLGLSLSDQYWLKPEQEEIAWEEVNFFQNEFSTELGENFFRRGSSRPSVNPFTPDASSNGWLKKKWLRSGGRTYLVKAGSAPNFQEPYNEEAASKILERLGISHVSYEVFIEQERPLCVCPNFITPDTEFVPAYFVNKILAQSRNDNAYTHLLRCAEKLAIPEARSFLEDMLCFDYLVQNSDRHFGNFGFIRDVRSLEFLGAAPLFDNGTSLWCEAPLPEIGRDASAKPFRAKQQQQLQLVKNISFDRSKVDGCAEIVHEVLKKSPFLESRRVELVREGVAARARGLQNFLEKLE